MLIIYLISLFSHVIIIWKVLLILLNAIANYIIIILQINLSIISLNVFPIKSTFCIIETVLGLPKIATSIVKFILRSSLNYKFPGFFFFFNQIHSFNILIINITFIGWQLRKLDFFIFERERRNIIFITVIFPLSCIPYFI